MYYERLLKIFNSNKLISAEFPTSLITQLDDFININGSNYRKILSPFQFANFANIKSSSALKFFMLFAKNDGIFDMIYYIDCSFSQCTSRVYLSSEDLDNMDNIVYCEECDRVFKISDIIKYIKINFQLKEIKESVPKASFDENSAYDVLKGCNPDLKVQSPSSLDSPICFGEGDISQGFVDVVTLEDVVANNEIQNELVFEYLRSITASIHG